MLSFHDSFHDSFEAATGRQPFPWQETLFAEFLQNHFRQICDVPTGLGKTSVLTIWLLALARRIHAGDLSDFPRRLIYVVNRRTIVDQATREAERLRNAVANHNNLQIVANALRSLSVQASSWSSGERAGPALAISTLRGQFADNAEWRNDPAQAAIIVGTVDMIGSRLLFAGYGCGFKSRPLHAGFLGQDALLVHDEAHLEPAFHELLATIEAEQERSRDYRRLRVMALTATSRSSVGGETPVFSDADREHPEVNRRFRAKKSLALHPVEDAKGIGDEALRLALNYRDSKRAIMIFLRKLDDVQKVVHKLTREKLAAIPLTGTIRGLERDRLATTDPIFARFMPPLVEQSHDEPKPTVYLVCTSAGEVGIDISADHLICDLTPFDSMAQRFGRVNRRGTGDAQIDTVFVAGDQGTQLKTDSESKEKTPESTESGGKQETSYEHACELTLALLRRLPRGGDGRFDASPAALSKLPTSDRRAAFTPPPVILPATDILFDAWALTSIREQMPGRPPVGQWLHGVADWEPPETYVAWRKEVEVITGDLLERYSPDDLLDDYPVKPHELLRDRADRIFKHLKTLADRDPQAPVWIVGDNDSVKPRTLGKLVTDGEAALNYKTVLLPPKVGGLKFDEDGSSTGIFDGTAEFDESHPKDCEDSYDVADCWLDGDGNPRRIRCWDDEDPPEKNMRLVRAIDTSTDVDQEIDADAQSTPRRYWKWYVRPRSADDDGSRTARNPQDLQPHLASVEGFAAAIVDKLRLAEPEASAVRLAARFHDLGKRRKNWQLSIRNFQYPDRVLAKSGGRLRPLDLNHYRHEFGSLIDLAATNYAELGELDSDARALTLHLIAAHHGRARPHFPPDEAFDPERSADTAAAIALEVPRRFARMQRKYGRWGLAYLESLLRAADALASQANDAG